jgi:hypothetical protein
VASHDNYNPAGPEIKTGDFDLDGEADVLVLLACDGRGNHQYRFFTAEIKQGKLLETQGFEHLSDPVFNDKKRLFYSTEKFHGGMSKTVYKIEDRKVVLVKQNAR